jgi:pantoate--beta-alanine ligase
MEVIPTVAQMRDRAEEARCSGRTLALVPTMGALHAGHLALVEEARRRGDHVTVSIFVNPTQFGPGEDFDRYPRTLEADLEALVATTGVDCVFAPPVDEVYPAGARTVVEVEGLDRHLCGAHRPGHFRGVATVVTKLFLACRPHVAVFGKKDAQQYVILRRLAQDLGLGVDVVGVETVREDDGLAMSSRNRYLSDEARRQAVVLSRAVLGAREEAERGERDAQALFDHMLRALAEASMAQVQYAEVVDAETLSPVARLESGREALAAVAVYLDGARLIDNQFITVA